MALTVNTNIASLVVQKNLNQTSDALSRSMTRLSSGLRINSAKDDAAGLQIATRLTTQVRGMTVAMRNAGNAMSIAQTAEGALGKSVDNLQRMRELAIQSKNANYGAQDRAALNAEFQEGIAELTRLAQGTKFGADMKLLDGSAGRMTFHVGPNVGRTEEIELVLSDDFSSEALFKANNDSAQVLEDANTTGSSQVVAGQYYGLSIDGKGSRNTGPDVVALMAARDGATKALTSAETALAADSTNAALVAARDTAKTNFETAQKAVDDICSPALVTARDTAKTALDTAETALAAAPTDADLIKARNLAKAGLDDVQKSLDKDALTTKNKPLIDKAVNDNIDATIVALDAAIERVNAARANIGAKQNRISSAMSNLDNMIKNVSASRGQIEDVDFAAETAELTKQQTLQQASTAILAQANQLPAAVLKLLQ